MGFTPDEAGDRIIEYKLKPSAAILYSYGYCRFRNVLTGRCYAKNETLAAATGINIAQLSTSKTQLLATEDEEGNQRAPWIVRDPENLKWGVIPVMGAREFEERRRWKWRSMSEEDRWKFQNSGELIWNFQTGNLEKPNLQNMCQIIDVPRNVPSSTSDAAASNLEIPKQGKPGDGDEEPVTDTYVEQLIRMGAYPPNLNEATVRYVWREMQFRAATDSAPWTPTRKMFRGWLRNQRAIVQAELPEMAAPVVAPRFDAAARPAATVDAAAPGNVSHPLPARADCDVCEGREEYRTSAGLYCQCRICQRCYGYGMESLPGKGARRCPHLAVKASERQARAG
ncbi:MAG TPA: hypothetical protein VF668_01300 [Pyrinomonadaceae bacterium]|jgi:hypothetical protein